MSIPVSCGHCQKRFAAPDHLANQSIKCPACRQPMKVGPAPVVEELLPLSAFNAEEIEPSPYATPSLAPPPGFLSAPGYPSTRPSSGVFGNLSSYRATNLMFITGLVVAMLIALGMYTAFLPTGLALYMSGAVAVHGAIIILFMAVLPRQDRSQFDWLYKLVAFFPAGIVILYCLGSLAYIIWGDIVNGRGIPIIPFAIVLVIFAVAIGASSLVGAIYLFCFRKFGFWRTHAVSYLVSLIIGVGYVPFLSHQIRTVEEQKIAQEARRKAAEEESERSLEKMRAETEQKEKEREAKQKERDRINAELQEKQAAERRQHAEQLQQAMKERHAASEDQFRRDYFKRKIDSAWNFGKNREGRDLLYADMLSNDGDDLTMYLKVCTAIKRPVINVHWAMAVETTPVADDENPVAGAGVGIGSTFVPSLRASDQETLAKDFAQRAGAAGVMIGETLSARAFEGRFGPWGNASRFGFSRNKARGVTMLAPSSTDSLLSAARSLGADALVAANVQVRPSNSKTPDATLMIRILDVANGKELWRSEKLTTGRVLAARRRGLRDPGLDLAEAALQKIEQDFVLKPVPELKPDVAQKRAERITSTPTQGKLAVLAELRFYELQGWLTTAQALEYYSRLLGPQNAAAFTSERLKERQETVEKLVVEQPY